LYSCGLQLGWLRIWFEGVDKGLNRNFVKYNVCLYGLILCLGIHNVGAKGIHLAPSEVDF